LDGCQKLRHLGAQLSASRVPLLEFKHWLYVLNEWDDLSSAWKALHTKASALSQELGEFASEQEQVSREVRAFVVSKEHCSESGPLDQQRVDMFRRLYSAGSRLVRKRSLTKDARDFIKAVREFVDGRQNPPIAVEET